MTSTNGTVDTSSTEKGTWRKDIENAFDSAKQVIGRSLAPISPTPYTPSNDPNLKKAGGLLGDLHKMGFKDVETLLQALKASATGVIDDNTFFQEYLTALISKLDVDSKLSSDLSNAFIGQLWNALPHPPLTSLGTKYKYRQADGSYNNIRIPELGAANTPYARSAKPVVLQNVALPDPALIFDSLMARGDTFEPHPNKISSELFYLATIIIHDLFKTVSSSSVSPGSLLLNYPRTIATLTIPRRAATLISLLYMEVSSLSKMLYGHSRVANSSLIASPRSESSAFLLELGFILLCSTDITTMWLRTLLRES